MCWGERSSEMPVKVMIAKFDPSMIPDVEVEIPDTCPACGADLTEDGAAVIEGAYM